MSGQLLNVLAEQVEFQIYPVAHLLLMQISHMDRMRNKPDRERVAFGFRNRQRDTIQRDASLMHEVTSTTGRTARSQIIIITALLKYFNRPQSVDMPADKMAADLAVKPQAALQIHSCSRIGMQANPPGFRRSFGDWLRRRRSVASRASILQERIWWWLLLGAVACLYLESALASFTPPS